MHLQKKTITVQVRGSGPYLRKQAIPTRIILDPIRNTFKVISASIGADAEKTLTELTRHFIRTILKRMTYLVEHRYAKNPTLQIHVSAAETGEILVELTL